MGPDHLRNSNGKSTEATIALMSTNQCASISTHIYIYTVYIFYAVHRHGKSYHLQKVIGCNTSILPWPQVAY